LLDCPGEVGKFCSGMYDVLLSVDRGEVGAIVGEATGIGGGARLVGGASLLDGSAVFSWLSDNSSSDSEPTLGEAISAAGGGGGGRALVRD
jgi:hypothetical protein